MKPIVTNQPREKLSVESEVSIETFVVLVKSGIELWTRAGEMLVKLVAENPNVYSEIIARNPAINFEMLLAFERMGRKQIYPPLLMDNSPAAKRLLELPYDVQEKYCREPIEVVLESNGSDTKTEKKYLKELSHYEAQTVFGPKGVKTLDEQKLFVATHGKRGRKKGSPKEKIVGTFALKMSPSGAVVAERVSDKVLAPKVKLFERDGVKQCVISLIEV